LRRRRRALSYALLLLLLLKLLVLRCLGIDELIVWRGGVLLCSACIFTFTSATVR